jgi:cell division transport system permease protein
LFTRTQTGYVLRESLAGFRRRKLTTGVTILIMGSALLVLALFSIVTINIGALLDRARTGIDVRVFLAEGMTDEEAGALHGHLARLPGVKRVEYVSKEQALAEFRRELGEETELLDALEENPLPASFHVMLTEAAVDADRQREIADDMRRWPGVEDVAFSEEWARLLDRWRHVFATATLIIGLVVFVAAVFVISNTVKLTVAASARAVEIMKQVGATNAFIRTPFLFEGMLEGLCGGLFAMAVLVAAHAVLRPSIEGLIFFTPAQVAGFVMFCVGLGLLGSWAALHKYLRL